MIPTKITAEAAVSMPRFDFIALWLVVKTRKKENRGRLGWRVKHADGVYKVMSPISGGTVIYEMSYPALLFDWARRTQLGPLVREADHFRIDAIEAHRAKGRALGITESSGKSGAQLDREITDALAARPKPPRPAWKDES